MATPTVYTIPAHEPFVDQLAAGVLEQCGRDPAQLAQYTILLPTRRACRSLREAFLRLSDGQPLLLPRMSPIGDVDEDDLLLGANLDITSTAQADLSLPPSISAMRRQLLLMTLIQMRPPHASPDQAARLAQELARLIDQVATEQLDFADLPTLNNGEYSEHWNETLQFLEIITENWPAILADQGGYLDPAERRNRLLMAQVDAWQKSPPTSPIIAAGSTGTIPATTALLEAIATLPQGCVILPGLDQDLNEDAWEAVGPTHPQSGLKHLLENLKLSRGDVQLWSNSILKPTGNDARTELLRLALLPAEVTGTPVTIGANLEHALDGVERINCPDPGKEAETIALILRHTLETPGKTAALITPDRSLARRVASELQRWNIDVDDSAGIPLDQTPAGAFLRLTAAMMANDLAPIQLLAALKHPLATGGLAPTEFRKQIRHLERAVLHGVRPAAGFTGLLSALETVSRRSIDVANLKTFVTGLAEKSDQFLNQLNQSDLPLSTLLRTHVEFAQWLASTVDEDGAQRLWRGDSGEALAGFVAELHDALDEHVSISGQDYVALIDTLLMGRVVRSSHNSHPRIRIWGPLEARLQHADVLILGSLNEGSWPPEPEASPWMSRPMMAAFGLPLPERRIGLSSHDFAQAFSAPNIIITRAERVDGTPTVPSRWVRRLENLIKGSSLEKAFEPDPHWLSLALRLDIPDEYITPQQPKPTPPVSARPRKLSVTRIAVLQRDPYSIYASYVLKLKKLNAIDSDPGAADRGTIIHDVLEEFLRTYPDTLPKDAIDTLIQIGGAHFDKLLAWPDVRAFWWPRFLRIAAWFIDNEIERRRLGNKPLVVESKGEITFDAPGGQFTLTARADRIDQISSGNLAILDYKTGAPPTGKQVVAGFEPQLPLEAAIAQQGKFEGLESRAVDQLTYIQLSGGRVPGFVRHLDMNVAEVARDTWEGVQNLITEYDNEDTPYRAHTRPHKIKYAGDYDHLARVREWRSAEDDE